MQARSTNRNMQRNIGQIIYLKINKDIVKHKIIEIDYIYKKNEKVYLLANLESTYKGSFTSLFEEEMIEKEATEKEYMNLAFVNLQKEIQKHKDFLKAIDNLTDGF